MKKTLIFSVTILLLIMCMPSVYGWKNGSLANTPTEYNYETDYGTHDWIADEALSILYEDNSESWQWLMDRREIFLVGTEAPDDSVSIVLDGISISGFGDKTYHHIYFNEDGSIDEDDSALRTKSCGDLANSYINDDKFDIASFYLGAMCHYIGDMSVYCHVKPESYFDAYHTTIEGYVDTRTDQENDREEFFQFSSITIENQAPYDVAKELAWNTCDDTEDGQDAQWLYDNHFTNWKLTYSARSSDTLTHQEYYDRIEESLNLAIKGCADAISYELDYDPENEEDDTIPFIFGWGWLTFFLAIGITTRILMKKIKI